MPRAAKGLLIISSGAKVAIAQAAAQAARPRGLVLHATDSRPDVPTRRFADKYAAIPRADEQAWIHALLDYCAANAIGLAIPARHDDLLPLARARQRFEAAGVELALSSQEALAVCIDKLETHRFLRATGIDSPETVESANGSAPYPHIAKPRYGSASQGVVRVASAADAKNVPDGHLLQEALAGDEYTVNVYLSRAGRCVCAVPHQRILVESGESVQAITRRIEPLMSAAARAAEALPGAWGPLNFQAFYEPETRRARFFEINPRLGGGFPLAHQAKAEFIEWLCQEAFDKSELLPFDHWTENLLMMKYRQSVFEIR